MSIYSGFPTRKDQSKYNNLLVKLITTLQNHVLELVDGVIPSAKANLYTKIITRMRNYQEHKYLPPKISEILDPLCKIIGISCSYDLKQISMMPQLDDRYSNANDRMEKGKISSQSLQKGSIKQRLKSEFDAEESKRQKKGNYLFEDKYHIPLKNIQGNHTKKNNFQSSFDLKQDKNVHTGYPKETKVMQLGQQYHQPDEIVKNWVAHQSGGTLKYHNNLIIPSKSKKNPRYQAFKALGQAQQNINNRQIPLRQQMRRKLKTEEQSTRKAMNNN